MTSRKVSQEELDAMIEAHGIWLKSKGKNGTRLELRLRDISGLDIEGAILRKCVMNGCIATDITANDCRLEDSDLRRCRFNGSWFIDAVLERCNMEDIIAYNVKFENAFMKEVSLQQAIVCGSTFDGADMTGATMVHMNASPSSSPNKHSKPLIPIPNETNATSFVKTRLIESDLEGADLSGCVFSKAKLHGADFSKSNIHGCEFEGAYVDESTSFVNTIGEPATTVEVEPENACGSMMHPLRHMSRSAVSNTIGFNYDIGVVDNEQYAILVDHHSNERVVLEAISLDDSIEHAAHNCNPGDPWGVIAFWENASADEIVDPFLRFKIAKATNVNAHPMSFLVRGIDMSEVDHILDENGIYVQTRNVIDEDGPTVIVDSTDSTSYPLEELVEAEEVLSAIVPDTAAHEQKKSFGRSRSAVRQLKKVTQPMKVAAFKKTFPEAFELIKHDIKGGTLTPESAEELIERFGMTWQITMTRWTSELQRLSVIPNDVMQLNIDLALVTDDPQVLKTIESIRQTSYRSMHPVRRNGLFTVGWVRYSVYRSGEVHPSGPASFKFHSDVLLVEEVQSDLPIVRKGLDDDEFKRQLQSQGLTDAAIRDALNILQPYVDRFYHDALALVFDVAHEAGLTVEMLTYEQKEQFGSPRSLYEQLPKQMGMKKVAESQLPFIEGKVWSVKPNPVRRSKKLTLPKRFVWTRTQSQSRANRRG